MLSSWDGPSALRRNLVHNLLTEWLIRSDMDSLRLWREGDGLNRVLVGGDYLLLAFVPSCEEFCAWGCSSRRRWETEGVRAGGGMVGEGMDRQLTGFLGE